MLSVLLLILKIIGIILLVILGIVLLVLFVPIFYKGNLHYSDEEFKTHLGAHWLGFPVRFNVDYENDKLTKSLKIFGINILKEKEKKPREEYKPPKAEISYENELVLEAIYGKESDEYLVNLVDDDTGFSDRELLDPKFSSVDYPEIDVPDMEDIDTGIKDNWRVKLKKKFRRKKKLEKPKVKKPLSRKIKIKAIKTKSRTLDALARSVKAVETAMKKIQVILEKFKEYIDFINRKSTRKAFSKMMDIVKEVVKHVFPNKITGKIEFGFEEPHLTGQALGGIAFAYDMLGIDPEDVEVIPYFDKETIDARLEYKGHIKVVVLVYYFIKFMLDPDIRKTMKFISKQKND